MEDYGIDIFSCSREEKEKVRGELIAHGMKMREETGGKYWVEKIMPHLQSCEKIPVISDFRFPNERLLVAEKMETVSIYIETFNSKTGKIHAPTIEEEIKHDADIRKMADVRVFWPMTNGNFNLLIPYVVDAIEKTREILKF